MAKHRTDRLNSLLKEVISEVLRDDMQHRQIPELITVTRVDITKDLHYAKVYISLIGDEKMKEKTLASLQTAAGFIAITASKKVRMRYFPSLTFKLDDSMDKQMRIEEILTEIHSKENKDNDDAEE